MLLGVDFDLFSDVCYLNQHEDRFFVGQWHFCPDVDARTHFCLPAKHNNLSFWRSTAFRQTVKPNRPPINSHDPQT